MISYRQADYEDFIAQGFGNTNAGVKFFVYDMGTQEDYGADYGWAYDNPDLPGDETYNKSVEKIDDPEILKAAQETKDKLINFYNSIRGVLYANGWKDQINANGIKRIMYPLTANNTESVDWDALSKKFNPKATFKYSGSDSTLPHTVRVKVYLRDLV